MKKKRRIGVMVGSTSDFVQCLMGFYYLLDVAEKGFIHCPSVRVNSIHRNTQGTLFYIFRLWLFSFFWELDALIVGAGWANHLTGITDAFLRYALRSRRIVIIGVAFENDDPKKTEAAILSITQVPGTQVVFDNFVGPEGFLCACKLAVEGELPKLKIPAKKATHDFDLRSAIAEGEKLHAKAA